MEADPEQEDNIVKHVEDRKDSLLLSDRADLSSSRNRNTSVKAKKRS
jgi:hypothetical protein